MESKSGRFISQQLVTDHYRKEEFEIWLVNTTVVTQIYASLLMWLASQLLLQPYIKILLYFTDVKADVSAEVDNSVHFCCVVLLRWFHSLPLCRVNNRQEVWWWLTLMETDRLLLMLAFCSQPCFMMPPLWEHSDAESWQTQANTSKNNLDRFYCAG